MRRNRLAFVSALVALVFPLAAERAPSLPQAAYTHLIGGLHTHTGYSDGAPGTRPADAYARARDVEGLDFFAVTEHSETLDVAPTLSEGCLPTEGGAIVECATADPSPDEAAQKWDAQRRQAAQASRPGSFTALRGFEWSSDVHGHMNVYFSRNYTQWVRDGGNVTTAGFFEWLRSPAWLGGGDDGLATFNHAGDKTICDQTGLDGVAPEACAHDPAANWNDFAYDADLDDRIVGIEIFNRRRAYEPFVVRALDKGWHLGLVGAEDIHETNWGSPAYAKTVMLAADRTPPALKDAMAARRIYATLDPTVRIALDAGGSPMGSRLNHPGSDVPLTVHVDGGDVARIDVLTNGGSVFATAAGRDLSVALPKADVAWYLARVVDSAGKAIAYSSPVWIEHRAPTEAFGARWVAGDLHVHTTWSHDAFGGAHDHNTGPDEAYTLGWSPGEQISIAESRGLDYVALTDHNNTFSVFDPGYSSGRTTLVPAYENSLGGHAQMINTSTCVAPTGPVNVLEDCNRLLSGSNKAQVAALATRIRDAGGLFQVNHPSDGDWIGRFGDGSSPDPIVPDTVEVWNIGPWPWQPPAPSSNDNDFSLRFWESYLNAGYRVAATGGSDNHWRSTTAAQGVGQPTTWIYVTKPGVAGIVEGLRAGRTTISHLPPAMRGSQLFIGADANGDGNTDAAIGGTTTPGATLQIRATNLPPGALYRIAWNGGVRVVERTGDVTTTPIPDGATWIRAELFVPDLQAERTAQCEPLAGGGTTLCRNRLIMAALTSPIYVAS